MRKTTIVWLMIAVSLMLHFFLENYKPYANTLTQTELETLCRLYGKSEGKEKEIKKLFQPGRPTDPLPAGCRPCQSLREKEKTIQRDADDGIIPYGGGLTVLQLM